MNSKVVAVVFFAAYLVVGLSIFRDYGLSWDEPISRLNGIKAYRYVFEGDKSLFRYRDRYYGTAFELPLYALEKWSGITDPERIFFFRHAITFLLFYISAVIFHRLCAETFHSHWRGLLGVLLYILHPRIFADSFYNSKDIAFSSAFVIAVYTGLRFVRKPTVLRAVVFAVAASFATDIRIAGGLVYLLILPQILWSYRKKLNNLFKPLAVCIGASVGFTYAFWPVLWSNPLDRFFEALRYMSSFSQYENGMLYMGKQTWSHTAPWHYLFVWIGITTPVALLALSVLGFVRILMKRNAWGLMMAAWALVPLVAVLITRPALYDGWRQFYFIYPAIVGLALEGLTYLWTKGIRVRGVAVSALALTGILTVSFMVRNHPYQNVYFNEFVGGIRGAQHRFDLDYWGLSFKRGLQYIAKTDSDYQIPVFFAFGIKAQADFLPFEDRRFMPLSDANKARYILSNFRWQMNTPPYPEIYHVAIDGVKIMSVFQAPD